MNRARERMICALGSLRYILSRSLSHILSVVILSVYRRLLTSALRTPPGERAHRLKARVHHRTATPHTHSQHSLHRTCLASTLHHTIARFCRPHATSHLTQHLFTRCRMPNAECRMPNAERLPQNRTIISLAAHFLPAPPCPSLGVQRGMLSASGRIRRALPRKALGMYMVWGVVVGRGEGARGASAVPAATVSNLPTVNPPFRPSAAPAAGRCASARGR